MELDQQKQFRVGRIEVLGLDRNKETLLKWKLKPGDVFNVELFEDFFKDNKSLFPPTCRLGMSSSIATRGRVQSIWPLILKLSPARNAKTESGVCR
jgi:hypothetical protein